MLWTLSAQMVSSESNPCPTAMNGNVLASSATKIFLCIGEQHKDEFPEILTSCSGEMKSNFFIMYIDLIKLQLMINVDLGERLDFEYCIRLITDDIFNYTKTKYKTV